eukprot:CAMPEP_0181081494 /NCGR_PEP_ID=MMETSP1071-20121207/3130_1 /TAXON_ID=35127 /ORGANISM="Thalassiosira sp., Strain NH16" /LENGTH=726 /DNA_ID=CAMNT_0023163041 /DNA_START=209 /DNA_END=2390 /DNA_ORIENTATION=-
MDVTIAILHFGISHTNPDDNEMPSLVQAPKLNNSPESPPTVIYGKHATTLGDLLKQDGIPVRIAHDPQEVQVAAAKKLSWSSLMWLMCHSGDDSGDPVTVQFVHQYKSNNLQRLAEEVMPQLEFLASEPWTKSNGATSTMPSRQSIGSLKDILEYLRLYSMSISNGNVIPSRELALIEIQERNGLLLSLMKTLPPDRNEQESYHSDLVRHVAGKEVLAQCFLKSSDSAKAKQSSLHGNHNQCNHRIKCTSSNLEFLFRSDKSTLKDSNNTKSAVVVGAGMDGGLVYSIPSINAWIQLHSNGSENKSPPPNDGGSENLDIDPGTATSSSFAWLNSNGKTPLSYKQLNQLGMEIWRRHDVLKHIPVWCGSLVQIARQGRVEDDCLPLKNRPYYSCLGPLDLEEKQRLEPGVAWPSDTANDQSEIYFYPEEGHVNPVEAVKLLRLAAHKNGVDFVGGVRISHLVRNENDKVIGVEYRKSHAHHNEDASEQPILAMADIVVVAAGANSSHPILGVSSKKLQLLEQPGVLAYARRKNIGNADDDSGHESRVLSRIFVDTIAQAHILRRPDKTIVIGGGQLVVGGKEDSSIQTTNTPPSRIASHSYFLNEEDTKVGNSMAKNAVTSIAPFELQPSSTSTDNSYELVRVSRANRPMPYDGLPVIGFIEQGLYVAVTHSGITLGPMIGELVSYELWYNKTITSEEGHGISMNGFQILDNYRPSSSRFHEMGDSD